MLSCMSPVQGPADRSRCPLNARHPQFHSHDRIQYETGTKGTCDSQMVSITVCMEEQNGADIVAAGI